MANCCLFCTSWQLNGLLDLAQPWTWVLYDPSGTSSFHHMDKVQVSDYDPNAPEGEEGPEGGQQQQNMDAIDID